jgi:hypothetical protein
MADEASDRSHKKDKKGHADPGSVRGRKDSAATPGREAGGSHVEKRDMAASQKLAMEEEPPLLEEVLRLWNRPLLVTSTLKDIGRLVRGMDVLDARGAPLLPATVLFKGVEGDISRTIPRTVYGLFLSLARALEPPEVAAALETHFWSRVQDKESGDLAGQLAQLLGPAEKGGLVCLDENSRLVRLLKTCNQEILAPAVLRLKLHIHRHLQYKDLRGQWHIAIELKPNGHLLVSHNKREQSSDSTPENQFEFSWSLLLELDGGGALLSANLAITDYVFNEKTSRAKQNEVKRILEPHVVPELPYRHVLSRPASALAQELLRFAKVTEVVDQENKSKLYTYSPLKMTMRCAYDIIEAIARQLEPHLVPQLQTHYASVCRETEVGTLQQFQHRAAERHEQDHAAAQVHPPGGCIACDHAAAGGPV